MPYIGIKAIYALVTYNCGFRRVIGTLGYLVLFIKIQAYNYRRHYYLYRSTIAAISISIAQYINLNVKGGTASQVALLSSYIYISNYFKASFLPFINAILPKQALDLINAPLYLSSAKITLLLQQLGLPKKNQLNKLYIGTASWQILGIIYTMAIIL